MALPGPDAKSSNALRVANFGHAVLGHLVAVKNALQTAFYRPVQKWSLARFFEIVQMGPELVYMRGCSFHRAQSGLVFDGQTSRCAMLSWPLSGQSDAGGSS